jgi:hypothetical protein
MNKERYNQVIDEVYGNYLDGGEVKWLKQMEVNTPIGKMNIPIPHPKEEFINKCKTDSEFSERWGLKIEERELSEKERIILAGYDYENGGGIGWNMIRESVDMDNSIPTKLITITYNDKTIESYE